jgi:pyrroline-5-carboxylate reductase
MNKTGFIGYGHMGSVLLNSLVSSQAIEPSQVIVATQTRGKLDGLHAKYPAIEIAENNLAVVKNSDVVFLCVGTYQVKSVLLEIQNGFHANSHLVIISGGLEITSVETLVSVPVTKIMPTLLAEVQEGTTLVCHTPRVLPEAQKHLERLLSHIGTVKVIAENQFEVGADFTSCAPGLFAAICDQYIRAGILESDFSYEEVQSMLLGSLAATVKLLQTRGEGLQDLIGRVATLGGATEGGVSILEAGLPEVFGRVFAVIKERHEKRKQVTRQQFMNE